MVARTTGLKSLVAGLIVVVALVVPVRRVFPQVPAREPRGAAPQRIVSLVPALTEMLFAIGAGHQVVAVSSYDEFPPEARVLPRVGALLDPDVERILSVRPDLVLTYGSQGSLESQLGRVGIRTFSYRHAGLAGILQTMAALGVATGHADEAARAVATLSARLDAVRTVVRGRPRPRVLLVFGRQPRSLRQLYASGGLGFLHDVLEVAGGENVFADVDAESVQPSQETLLARAPDVIIEVRSSSVDAAAERSTWSTLPAIPAVRQARIHYLTGSYLVVPGPRVAAAAEAIAHLLHPGAFR